MFRKSAIAAALLVFGSTGAFALGLGDISMKSALNQPMLAEIDLTSAGDSDLSEIKVSVASQAAHQRAGMNRSALLSSFRFAVEKTPSGNVVVKVTSTETIREPFIEFMVQLEWPKGRLLREYTLLVDPPVTMPATPAVPVAPVSKAARPLSEPARSEPIPAPRKAVAAPVSAPATVSAAPAVADSYGPIKRSDTLWSIAERMRPDTGISIHQMMQALLRANPDAFIDNNINNMKAGVTLHMPERSEILAMSAREAAAESSRQYAQWKGASQAATAADATVQEPAQTAAPGPYTPTQDAAQSESASGSGAAAAPEVETRLTLVAPEGDAVSGAAAPGEPDTTVEAGADAADLQQQLTLASEDAAASRAQSQELKSRVNELEKQIDTMKRLLELKDHALAQLQNRAGAAAEQSPQEEQTPPAEQAVSPEEQAVAPDEPSLVETGQAAVRDWLSYLTANPLYTGAAAGVLLLLAGLGWLFTRRRDDDEPDDDLMTLQGHLESRPEQRREVPMVNVREPEPAEEDGQVLDSEHEHDPLTEADVFLAYGRIQQAEDTLREALVKDPDSEALQLKLLEVFHTAGNVAAFEQAAAEYHAGLDEDDERWLRVARMGYALSPRNELFSAARPPQLDADTLNIDLADVSHGVADQHTEERHARPELPDALEIALEAELAEDDEVQDGILASEDEVTTKLDLARAYIDMDDRDSARSILDEVMEEGNSDQKEEAGRIIAKLA